MAPGGVELPARADHSGRGRLALRAPGDIRRRTRPRRLLGLRRAPGPRAGLWQFRTAPIVTREHGNDRVVLLCAAGAARRRGRARGCEDLVPTPARLWRAYRIRHVDTPVTPAAAVGGARRGSAASNF